MELYEKEAKLKELINQRQLIGKDQTSHYQDLTLQIEQMKKEIYGHLSAWDRVALARHPLRLKGEDYLRLLFDKFYEMHGDRCFGDDPSIRCGIAMYKGQCVSVIAQCKGNNLEDNIKKNFGMPSPEGYRKAMRIAKQAEKFHRPIITIVDTPGAYPGKGAEERGQAQAIAECLSLFSSLKTIVICIVIGEGGSGGALALSVGDRIYMLENAIYSVLSPEGFASILYKDETKAKEAANQMKLCAHDLYENHFIDGVIKEPLGGVHECQEYVIDRIKDILDRDLKILKNKKTDQLLKERYEKYRNIGVME